MTDLEGTASASPTAPQEPHSEPPDEQEEPVVTGTVFLTLILLMMIFGFWALMYLTLLDR